MLPFIEYQFRYEKYLIEKYFSYYILLINKLLIKSYERYER